MILDIIMGVIGFIVYSILSIFILWIFYVLVMSWKAKKNSLPKWAVKVLTPIAIIGLILDIFINVFIGTWIYAVLSMIDGTQKDIWSWMPHYKRITLTARLQHALQNNPTSFYQFKVSMYICKYFLEPWDLGHCQLWKIKK